MNDEICVKIGRGNGKTCQIAKTAIKFAMQGYKVAVLGYDEDIKRTLQYDKEKGLDYQDEWMIVDWNRIAAKIQETSSEL